MNPRRPFVIVAVALLTSAFIALNDDGIEFRDTALAAGGVGIFGVLAEGGPAPSVAVAGDASPSRVAFDAASAHASRAPVRASPGAASGDDEAPIRISAPPFIDQGSPHELVVSFKLPRGARNVEFMLSADPEFVELRDAVPGEWGVHSRETFNARVDEVANRIAVRVESERGLAVDGTISLAIVRFEGVAAGSATITASEIAVRDGAGATLPVGAPSATAQLVVMSGPI